MEIMEIEDVKTTFPPYPDYKYSGAEWLGKVPAHWELLPNKNIFKLKKNQVGKKSADYVLLSLTLRGVIQRVIEDGGKFPTDFDTYQEVKKGDFVFCLFDVEETPRCIGLSNFDGMITGAYTVLEASKNFDKTFLYYFYLNLDYDKRMRPLYTGLRNTISKDNFFAFKTFVPPRHEQEKIASFLDDKTSKIDLAIAQKEKMIGLLKERKQIIIQNAVTKGLNPNAPTKHSGVEWIGEIPAHWEVKKVTHLFNKIGSGTTPTSGDQRYYDGEYPFLQTGDLTDGKVFSTNRTVKNKAFQDFSSLKLYPKGSLVMAMYGATIGKLGILQMDSSTNQACCVFGKANEVSIELFFYILLAFRNEIVSFGYGGGQPNISQDLIKSLRFALPPLSEQSAIVAHIEAQSAKIDKAIDLQARQIAQLKELKATLIDSAVTGKIKVS